MKIVAALTDPADASTAQDQGADIAELRFDLIDGDPVAIVQACRDACSMPIIATVRSAEEGGKFFGSAEDWFEMIRPVIPLVDYIDVEQRFSRYTTSVKQAGKTIIASHHTGTMIPLHDLFLLERDLRVYGDIVKIIVTPLEEDDIINLIAFTHAVKKPLCTGVMGTRFRYARAILPLFGSHLVYCHAGKKTADGQYSVDEFVRLMKIVTGNP
jgi:3-dehydroquinate dehydratase-1